jgi:hypothetical protein
MEGANIKMPFTRARQVAWQLQRKMQDLVPGFRNCLLPPIAPAKDQTVSSHWLVERVQKPSRQGVVQKYRRCIFFQIFQRQSV